MEQTLDLLRTRRSAVSLTLDAPGPDAEQLRDMLTIAARVPDHGKLVPWRFVVLEAAARARIASEIGALADPGNPKQAAEVEKLGHAPTLVMVVSTAADHPKIPVWEQHLSAGAVCQNLLVAATAHGFDAQWLTAWYVYDERGRGVLGLASGEQIAGLIHIGTATSAKTERPRPELDDILTRLER